MGGPSSARPASWHKFYRRSRSAKISAEPAARIPGEGDTLHPPPLLAIVIVARTKVETPPPWHLPFDSAQGLEPVETALPALRRACAAAHLAARARSARLLPMNRGPSLAPSASPDLRPGPAEPSPRLQKTTTVAGFTPAVPVSGGTFGARAHPRAMNLSLSPLPRRPPLKHKTHKRRSAPPPSSETGLSACGGLVQPESCVGCCDTELSVLGVCRT